MFQTYHSYNFHKDPFKSHPPFSYQSKPQPSILPQAVTVACTSLFSGTTPKILQKYSFNLSRILNGEYYRLGTYPFLHVDITHLATNMLSLNAIGPDFIHRWGNTGLVGVAVASVASHFFTSYLIDDVQTSGVGFSGILFAMEGALILDKARSRGWPTVANNVLRLLALSFIQSELLATTKRRVSHVAHLSGLFAGLVFSYFLPSR